MKLRFADRAVKDYAALEKPIRKALAKQLGYLLENLAHPPGQEVQPDGKCLAGPSYQKLAFLFPYRGR